MRPYLTSSELAEWLSVSELAKGLREEIPEELATRGSEKRAVAGELVFEEGDPPQAIWVVLEGAVVIYRERAGKAQLLQARLGSGAFFGEMSVMEKRAHASSACCCGATRLFRIEREALEEILESFPELRLRLWMSAVRRHGLNAKAALEFGQRNELRMEVSQPVRVEPVGGATRVMRLENFSPGGLGLSDAPLAWREGREIEIALAPLVGPPLLCAKMRIVWKRGSEVGLCWVKFDEEPLKAPLLLSRLLASG